MAGGSVSGEQHPKSGGDISLPEDSALVQLSSGIGTLTVAQAAALPISLRPDTVFDGVAAVFSDPELSYLNGRHGDAISALMVSLTAELRLTGQTQVPESETVPIDLEAARRDPKLILEMIRHTQLSEFHERLVNIDLTAFEARWQQYQDEGQDGLWDVIRRVSPEERVTARYIGRPMRKVNSGRRSTLSHLKRYANSKLVGDTATVGLPTLNSLEYIQELDDGVRNNHPSNWEGSRVIGSSLTQERLERYYALHYEDAFSKLGRHSSPRERGIRVVSEMMGEPVDELLTGSNRRRSPEWLKIRGLEYALDVRWADFNKQTRYGGRSKTASQQAEAQIPDDIVTMEAMVAKMTANALEAQGDDNTAADELLFAVTGMESIRADAARPTDTVGFLRLDKPNYTQEDFTRDIQAAATVRRLIRKFGNSRKQTAFDLRMYNRIRDLIDMSGGSGGTVQDAVASIFTADVIRDLGADDLEELARQTVLQRGLAAGSDPEGSLEADAIVSDLLKRRDAKRTDDTGRYAEQTERDRRRRGREQRQEDFPGEGRLLLFYGDLDPAEGDVGAIEGVSIATGAFDHIDTAGNSPLRSEVLRLRLEEFAAENSHPVEVHEPFGILPVDYLCEMAIYVNQMPDDMRATDLLHPVIDGGIVTLNYEDNLQNGLLEDLARLKALSDRYPDAENLRHFDIERVPTDLVRFVETEDGLEAKIGHADPDWDFEDHTVIIFLRGEKDQPNRYHEALTRALNAEDEADRHELES